MKGRAVMKNEQIKKYLWLICLIVIICGCAGPKGKRLDMAFYHLDYAPPMRVAMEPASATIAIEPFRSMAPFNTNRIIYSTSPVTYDAYAYHQWFSDPADMVFTLLFRDMRSAGIFRAVMHADDRLADYRVTGIVESFLEQDQQDPWQAVLSITITLIDKTQMDTSRQIVFQKNYTAIRPCHRKNPQALADAMSMALAEVSAGVIADIHTALSPSPAATP
ncbi:MAG: hypothetical protein C4548_10725 [Desulfobacteraceae bacterium]|jgi:ABC-type uncharacterized transport system auxiliary subunit|nr:MAG: hypothetical protein C4548_10725 [Desulfobacteraceae bacterium]